MEKPPVCAAKQKLREANRPSPYQTIHSALIKAEERAGVTHQEYRALHGGRRHVVGEVGAATGDRMTGLEYVGDTDPKMLARYDRRMPERLAKAADILDNRDRLVSGDVYTDRTRLDWVLAKLAERAMPGLEVVIDGKAFTMGSRDDIDRAMWAEGRLAPSRRAERAESAAVGPLGETRVGARNTTESGAARRNFAAQTVTGPSRKASNNAKNGKRDQLEKVDRVFTGLSPIAGAGFEPATFGL